MKYLPLFCLIIAGLGVTIAYGHTFTPDTVFNTSGGNITFAYNCTFDTYTYAGNQERWTTLEMNNNGSWTNIGFRNPDSNCTLNITALGENWVAMNCSIDADGTTYEVYLPDHGEPDNIVGANGESWASPTLDLTKTANGTITLEWTATSSSSGGGGGSLLLIIVLLFMALLMGVLRR